MFSSLLDGIVTVLNGIQASGVPLETTNLQSGADLRDGLWIRSSVTNQNILNIGATFAVSPLSTRIIRMFWQVAGDGGVTWAYGINRIPRNIDLGLIPSDGLNNAWDRNRNVVIQTGRDADLRVNPIFVAFDSATNGVGLLPSTQRLNGMVRFDEWLVHHIRGDRYDSMLPNYGASARLHPGLESVLQTISFQSGVDYVMELDDYNTNVPRLTPRGQAKILPWFVLFAANRGNFEGAQYNGVSENFLQWHLRIYGKAFNDPSVSQPEQFSRFKTWASPDPTVPGSGSGYIVPPFYDIIP